MLEHVQHNREHLPDRLESSLEERIAGRWLENYGTERGLAEVFARMAVRRPGFGPLAGAVADLQAARSVFAGGFDEFFPDLLRHVRDLGPEEACL